MTAAWQAAGVIAAAFCAGVVDAIVGGGGLLQLPALFSALPTVAPAVLLGTSKLAGALGTGAAALRYSRHLKLPWRRLLPACGLGLCGGLLGAMLATRAPVNLLRPLVPVLLGIVLLGTLALRRHGERHAPRTGRRSALALAALTGAIGLYDGFFGPGTGSFLMFMLVRTQGFDFLNASAAARVLNVSTNLAALGWFASHGDLLPGLGLAMGAANIAGALLGARLALRGGSQLVRRAFVLIVIVLIAKTARDAWFASGHA